MIEFYFKIFSQMEQFNFNNELSGKIALVTGGTKGAGKAIAERLLQAGATVIITARNEPKKKNRNLHFISADLSKPDGTEKVVQAVLEKYGQLDILINNLGSSETQGGGFTVLTDEDWEHALQTNLLAPVRLFISLPFKQNYLCTTVLCPMHLQRQVY